MPFTAYISVTQITGKRFSIIRDQHKIAKFIFEELSDDTDLQLALPVGSGNCSFSNSGSYSGLTKGLGTKPKFGDFPAQLLVTGFINDSSQNTQIHPDTLVIHAGESLSGAAGNKLHLSNPASEVDNLVKSLKTKLETAVTAVLGGAGWSIYRIDAAGVIYGSKGLHFPR